MDGLNNLINYLHGKNIYEDKKIQSYIYFTDIVKSIKKPLFFFLKYCFRLYYKKEFNSEIILADISQVWISYIKPWTNEDLQMLVEERSNSNNKETSPYSIYKILNLKLGLMI